MKKSAISVGIIGFGTVGAGTAAILLKKQKEIESRVGFPIVLKHIADLDTKRDRGIRLPKGMLIKDSDKILNDSDIDIVAELIGGIHPAKEIFISALKRGKHVVTANKALLAQEGTVDKFMGDAVMAWFNAPIPQEDHTLRAVKAALGIRDSIEILHTQLPSEFHLGFGVGIHYGAAVLGLVGTEKRIDYTAIGDSVNTAKRIQENAAQGQILISEDAYEFVSQQLIARKVNPIQAKGKREPLNVYEIIGLK